MLIPDKKSALGAVLICLLLNSGLCAGQPPMTGHARPGAVEMATFSYGEVSLDEAVNRLLQRTDQKLVVIGELDKELRVPAISGKPEQLLRELLRPYSYVLTPVAQGENPSVTLIAESDPVAQQRVAGSYQGSAQGGQSSYRGSVGRKSAGKTAVPDRPSTPVLAHREKHDGADETAPVTGYEPESETGTDVSELSRGEVMQEEARLEMQIKRLEAHINSGAAKTEYDRWAAIKDPRYLVNPWNDLAVKKARYQELQNY